ncbi:MAG: hypothetical protein A2W00_05910 [Candidatus Eisenbacteria bacterium RBG_16_71_46]|nr:MAG: hypothetical protein A2W00_05910 [Candidatus Eisenbacteria bacterium RBG_16_71_46]
MKLTLFSIDEANETLARIRPELERLVGTKRAFDRLQRRVDVLSLASAGAGPTNPDAVELKNLLERRRVLGERLKEGVNAVQRSGCVVKDLERGLVDFYSIAGDRLIFLCWQLGEPEVQHWHSLESGFQGRQPLKPTERS